MYKWAQGLGEAVGAGSPMCFNGTEGNDKTRLFQKDPSKEEHAMQRRGMGGTKLKAQRPRGKRWHQPLSCTRAEFCGEVSFGHAGFAVTLGHPSADAH